MPPGAPRALRCEYATNPIGLGTAQPRFFWQLSDDRTGAAQSAYRVLVASDRARLDRDEGDLWDSGEIASGDCAQIPYQGSGLGSRARAFWKVRSFDADGTASAWSEPASFELGFLDRSDWSARWIASPLMGAPRTGAVVPALRREFEVDASVASARLFVTTLGLYDIEINGTRVGDHQLAPGWTDYEKRVRYQVHDVTDLLQSGPNAIGALLGDGWYCGWIGLRKTREAYGKRPALLCQLEITHADGTRTTLASDGDWRWHASPILSSDIMQGETIDARRDLGAWTRAGYDDAGWSPVEVEADPGIALDAMSGPPVRALRELTPVNTPRPKGILLFPTQYIFDLGQNMVGWVRVKVRGREGTTITVRHAEVLDENGALYTENLKDAAATDTYTLRGTAEAETFEPRFTFHGFRYVEVAGRVQLDDIEEVTGVVLHSDMAETGAFECSDPDVNQLFGNVTWGQRGNFVDVPTDCPQRDERLGWTGDAQVFVKAAALNMDVAGFFTKWLVDLEDGQGPKGEIPMFAPNPGMGRGGVDGGPAWADAVVICPWTIYRCYGDIRVLEERFASMAAYLDYIDKRFPSGLRADPEIDPWGGFGDWVALDGTVRTDDKLGGTPKALIGTAFLSYCSGLLADIARVINRPDDEKRFRELSAKARDAFRRRFVTPDGLVAGNTQTSFLLALHFDLLEENERAVTASALARNVEAHGHLTTGFVGTPYLLHVLTDIGRLDLAYMLLLRRDFPSWLYPLVKGGATTIWERWDAWKEDTGFFSAEMNSFNHYAYGAVADYLYRTVAGLDVDDTPEAAGWKRARLAPRPPIFPGMRDTPRLASARAHVDTVRGRYETSWQIENDRFRFDALIPPGGSARVELPDGSRDEVSAGQHRFELSLDAIKSREATA